MTTQPLRIGQVRKWAIPRGADFHSYPGDDSLPDLASPLCGIDNSPEGDEIDWFLDAQAETSGAMSVLVTLQADAAAEVVVTNLKFVVEETPREPASYLVTDPCNPPVGGPKGIDAIVVELTGQRPEIHFWPGTEGR